MDFNKILEKRRTGILNLWQDRALAVYPSDGSKFFKQKKDPFANPVGHTLKQGLNGLLDIIFKDNDISGAAPFLDQIMKVRAVQDITPSGAVGFLFELKGVIRQQLKKDLAKIDESVDWQALDAKIDAMSMAGFDVYVDCREKINQIRVNEVRNLSYKAMKRANLVCDIEDLPENGADKTCS